ncbi:hypothetical protein ACLOJK_006683, partial [Asimina triloba]
DDSIVEMGALFCAQMNEDTNIRPGYISHKHLDNGLMPDIQVWMPTGSRDYGYESGYTPMLVGWETSIEPKFQYGEGVRGKKIKAVE